MYTYEHRVSYSEVSSEGCADAARIADYFQDCSAFQSDSLGVGLDYLARQNHTWVLASWQILAERYPLYGERIQVSTWPYAFDSVFGYRNFMLRDMEGNRLAVANSQWLLLDTASGHPSRITKEVAGSYPMDPKLETAFAPRKIPFREEGEAMPPLTVPRACIDTNHHVNNAQYIRMALEYVPEDFRIQQIRVEYKKAAVQGEGIFPFVCREGEKIKVMLADENKEPYAVTEFVKQQGQNA